MILLTGATGLLGGHVAKAVAGAGLDAKALVRNLDKAQPIADLGLTLVQGDLSDRASLDAALEGVDKAFLLMANGPQQLGCETQFIDAAKAAGVSHLIKLSAVGAEAGHSNALKHTHGTSEEHLKASGVPYTILRGNFFMQYLLYFMPAIENTGAFYVPPARQGDAQPIGMIDVRDIAACAAHLLKNGGHEGETLHLTGPQLLTFQDAAAAMSSVMGKEVGCQEIPEASFKGAMLNTGMDDWTATAVAEEFVLLAEGGGNALSDSVQAITGQAPGSLDALLKEALA